jgi:hypothetical protein
MVAGMFVELAYNTSGDCFYWVNRSVGGPISAYPFTMATDRLLGRESSSTGVIEEISLGGGLGLASTTLSLNGPSFSAYGNANQTGIASNTATKLQYNTEHWDSATCYDAATNYRFTPNVAGYYWITAGVEVIRGDGSDVTSAYMEIRKNNSATHIGPYQAAAFTGGLGVSGLVSLNGSTDYVEIFARATVAASNVQFTHYDGQNFQAHFVRGS